MPKSPPTTDAPLLGEPLPVELMNTIWADRDGVHDALGDTAAAGAWLRETHERLGASLPSRITPTVADDLRRLRDALRRLAATATADDRPAAASALAGRRQAVATLNRTAALAPAWSALAWGDEPAAVRRSAQPPAQQAVSAIAEAGIGLFSGPEREQLRACHGPGCVLYFVRDHPRREWCSATCGNRARVARHYQRHHLSSPG
jgi:predicted RNA-binding Zn ribbon-like protein